MTGLAATIGAAGGAGGAGGKGAGGFFVQNNAARGDASSSGQIGDASDGGESPFGAGTGSFQAALTSAQQHHPNQPNQGDSGANQTGATLDDSGKAAQTGAKAQSNPASLRSQKSKQNNNANDSQSSASQKTGTDAAGAEASDGSEKSDASGADDSGDGRKQKQVAAKNAGSNDSAPEASANAGAVAAGTISPDAVIAIQANATVPPAGQIADKQGKTGTDGEAATGSTIQNVVGQTASAGQLSVQSQTTGPAKPGQAAAAGQPQKAHATNANAMPPEASTAKVAKSAEQTSADSGTASTPGNENTTKSIASSQETQNPSASPQKPDTAASRPTQPSAALSKLDTPPGAGSANEIPAHAKAAIKNTLAAAAQTSADAQTNNASANASPQTPAAVVDPTAARVITDDSPHVPAIGDTGKANASDSPSAASGSVLVIGAANKDANASAEVAAPAQDSPASATPETYDQIVLGLKGQMDPRTGKANILLDPPNLGAVKVSLSLSNGTLTAQFESSNGAVRDLLKSNLDKLKSVLQGQGITVDKLSVNAPPDAKDANASGGQTPQNQNGSAAHDGRSSGGQQQDARSGQQRWGNQPRPESFARVFAQSQEAPIDVVA